MLRGPLSFSVALGVTGVLWGFGVRLELSIKA